MSSWALNHRRALLAGMAALGGVTLFRVVKSARFCRALSVKYMLRA